MNNSDDILKAIHSLDKRIKKIEQVLALNKEDNESIVSEITPPQIKKEADSFELQVGIYWLAKIGILAFTVGIIFLISSSFENMPTFLPSLLGLIFTGIFFSARTFGKKWLHYIDSYILVTGYILLFLSTLRLGYFNENVFINSSYVMIPILIVMSIAMLGYSLKSESRFLTFLSILFLFITSLLINNSITSLFCALIISVIIVWTTRKFKWPILLIFGIVFSYSFYFIWFVGNPILGPKSTENLLHTTSIFYILSTLIVYATGLLSKEKVEKEEFLKITAIFINSILASSSFVITMYANNIEDLSLFSFIAFLVFLIIAVISWIYERSKYATFFYSILGYMLLSISIIYGFQKPEYFVILSWQSLLVVSTAVWFRSRIIIVTNFIIYLIILLSFLYIASDVTYISISFGIIALLSARILNWKKKELKLNSEGMRNAYLICAFFIFPYSLYKSVPEAFITISWIGVSFLYYILSVLLKNTKYRWLALATLILSVVYVIFFGISELSPELRILTFIFLGIVLIIISLMYSKRKSAEEKSTKLEKHD